MKELGLQADSSRTLSNLYMELKEKQATMQGDIEFIKRDVTDIKDSMKQFHLDNKEQHAEILTLVEKISNEKANKWVEIAMTRLNWIIVTAVVGSVIYLVLK